MSKGSAGSCCCGPPTAKASTPDQVRGQSIIGKIRRNLFVSVTNRALAATNNGSERSLRPCVTLRKITNGFWTEWGAKLCADIRSVIETARRRAIPPLRAITLTLQARPLPLQIARAG